MAKVANQHVSITECDGVEYKSLYQACPVPVNELKVDMAYQRDPIPSHIKHIVDNFNPYGMKPLFIGKRTGGQSYYIIDGQQEWEAVKRLIALGRLKPDYRPTVRIVDDSTLKKEAGLFSITQQSKKVLKGVEFKSRLASGDEWCLGVEEVLRRYGMSYNKGGRAAKGTVTVSAIDYVEKKMKEKEDPPITYQLKRFAGLIHVINRSWGVGGAVPIEGTYTPLVQGLFLTLQQCEDVNENSIITCLGRTSAKDTKARIKVDSKTNGRGEDIKFSEYFKTQLNLRLHLPIAA